MTMKTLYLSGNLDKENCLKSYSKFKEIMDSGTKTELAINLHDVTDISAAAMVYFKDICGQIRQGGGRVCFLEASGAVHGKIMLNGFLLYTPFFSSPAFAQRYLSS